LSVYRIDLEESREDGIVLVKLCGRAQSQTIVNLLEELNALAIRIAAFASNPVIYGRNRTFQGLAEGAEAVRVFNDRACARAWLLEG
jgi:hypothetical protein